MALDAENFDPCLLCKASLKILFPPTQGADGSWDPSPDFAIAALAARGDAAPTPASQQPQRRKSIDRRSSPAHHTSPHQASPQQHQGADDDACPITGGFPTAALAASVPERLRWVAERKKDFPVERLWVRFTRIHSLTSRHFMRPVVCFHARALEAYD